MYKKTIFDFNIFIKFDGACNDYYPHITQSDFENYIYKIDNENSLFRNNFEKQLYYIGKLKTGSKILILDRNYQAFSGFDKYAIIINNELYYKPFKACLKQLELKYINIDRLSKETLGLMKATYLTNLESLQNQIDNGSLEIPEITDKTKNSFFSQDGKNLIFHYVFNTKVSSNFNYLQDYSIYLTHNSNLDYMELENPKYKNYKFQFIEPSIENRIKNLLINNYYRSLSDIIYWDEDSLKNYTFKSDNFGNIYPIESYTPKETRPEDFFELLQI